MDMVLDLIINQMLLFIWEEAAVTTVGITAEAVTMAEDIST